MTTLSKAKKGNVIQFSTFMFRAVTAFLLSFITLLSNAQEHRISFIVDEVQTNSPNTLVAEYYNRVGVIVENLDCDSINLTSAGCDIIKDRSCVFWIRVKNDSLLQTVTVLNGSKPIRDLQLTVDWNIKPLSLSLGGKSNNYPPRRLTRLFCSLPSYNSPPLRFKIKSFVVEIYHGNVRYSYYNVGEEFSDEIKEKYLTLFVRDTIIIRSLVVSDPEGRILVVPDEKFIMR